MEEFRKRHIAFKVNARDLLEGRYVKEEGEFSPNYVMVGNLSVSRLNFIGVIVAKDIRDDKNFRSLIADDGTGKISVRSFEPGIIDKFEIGNVVRVVGRIREYMQERYIVPEIIKTVDQRWLKFRKLELKTGQKTENTAAGDQETGNNARYETPKEMMLSIIRDLDDGNGANTDDVISRLKTEKADELVRDLLEKGEIFEVNAGRIKVLE